MSVVVTVDVHTQGRVLSSEVDYARAKILAAFEHTREPVRLVHVRLTVMPDPAISAPAVAQVNAELDGRLVRAQSAGHTVREAVDEVQDRLRRLVARASNGWEAVRSRTPERAPWSRAGASATATSSFRPRTDGERQIVRRKTYEYGRLMVEEAASDLEALSYEFHVFTERDTGVDSVISRAADGLGYEVAQLEPQLDRLDVATPGISLSPNRPPKLSEEQAIEAVNASGQPFLFFRHADTGRGCVLYHRYDGNYGLISAASQPDRGDHSTSLIDENSERRER